MKEIELFSQRTWTEIYKEITYARKKINKLIKVYSKNNRYIVGYGACATGTA